MVLPSKSDMRIEQMVTFVTHAWKLRYVCHYYYLENPVALLGSSRKTPPQREELARGLDTAALWCSHFLGQSWHQMSSREEEGFVPPVLSSNPIYLKPVPSLHDSVS